MAQNNNIQIKPYSVKSDKNWEADISEMEALIDERTRFIVVNDPSNPLGSCWSNEYKKKII
jgi:tyrosine aminotransferase